MSEDERTDRDASEDEGSDLQTKSMSADELKDFVSDEVVEEKVQAPDIDVDRPDLPTAPQDFHDLPEFKPVGEVTEEDGDGQGLLGWLERGETEEDDAETAYGEAVYEEPTRPLVYLPELGPEQEEEALYTIEENYLYVRVVWDEEIKEHLYEVLEPDLSHEEETVYEFIKDTLINTLDVDVTEMESEGMERYLREQVDEALYEYNIHLSHEANLRIKYYIIRDFLGYGKVDVLMKDPLIEDISCDGPGIPVFIYHRKFESMKTNIVYETDEELDSFVIKLAQRCRKHISIADPLLDATMPDGSRLQATLSREITTGGSTFTIRKFREDPFTPTTLIDYGTFSVDIMAYFWMAVQHGKSTIFAGGTASGKSTSLNAILLFIPPQMKIVSIEDTRELNLPHPNWIAGVTREGGSAMTDEGAGEIDMYTLLREALRQRPEYIVVGEVRGQEAYTLFQAMATGHTTYSTMHADSVESAIHRLNNDPINVPKIMLKALDIVSVQVQTRVGETRVRRCKQLVEIVGVDPHTDEILTNEVFQWNPAEDKFEFSGVSYVLEKIKHEKSMTDRGMQEELDRRKEIIQWMQERGVEDYRDVARIVTSYYKDPDGTMTKIREDLGVEAVARSAPGGEDAKEPAQLMTGGTSATGDETEPEEGEASWSEPEEPEEADDGAD